MSLAERVRLTGWSRPIRRRALYRRAARAAVAVLLAASVVPVSAETPSLEDPCAEAAAGFESTDGSGFPIAVPSDIGYELPGLQPPPPAAPPAAGDEAPWYDRWVDGLHFLGQKTFNHRWVSVTGSDAAKRFFRQETPDYANLTQFTVMGRILGALDVNLQFSDGRFGVDPRRMSVRFHRHGTQITAGDITASLAGNALIPFNRSLRAILLERQLNRRTTITGLVSEPRASTRRVDIPGNNTVGPYYLNAFPIVVDSVRVRIDELEVPRDSYVVDAYAGTITFRAGSIVPQTSTLHVSFESYSDGTPNTTLWGFRAAHSVGAHGSLGATVLMSEAGEATDGAGTRERTDDWYAGHADSNGPYHLRYGPIIRGSEQVFVAGVLQQPSRDYYLQYDRGVIQFTRFILSSEHIRVVYRQALDGQLQDTLLGEGIAGPYRLSQSPVIPGSETVVRVDRAAASIPQLRDLDYRIDYTTGTILFLREPLGRDQSVVVLYRSQRRARPAMPARVMGLDGALALGKHTRLSAQFAQSTGKEGASGSGVTLEARTGLLPAKFNGGSPRLSLGATWKKIDPEFSSMESVGFQRNDQGISLDGEFLLTEHARFFSRWDRSRRPLGFGAAIGSEALYDATQSYSGFTFNRPDWPQLNLYRMRLGTEGPGGSSSQSSDAAQIRYVRGQVTLGGEYNDSATSGSYSTFGYRSTGAAPTVTSARTTKLFAGFNPGSRLSLSASLANSDIASGDRSGRARDVDLSAVLMPIRGLQLTGSYRISDSGRSLGGLATGAGSLAGGATALNPIGGPSTLVPRVGPRGVTALQLGPGYTLGGAYGSLSGGIGGYGSASGFSSGYGGAYGGYGGAYGGYSPGYGSGYYGGYTEGRRAGLSYSPGSRLSLNLSLDRTQSELYGSTTGRSLGFTLAPGRSLSLAGTLTRQRSSFVHPDLPGVADGAMASDLMFLSMRLGPVRKVTLNLDLQKMRTNNTSGLTGVLPGSGMAFLSPAVFANDIQSITGRLSCPLGTGRTAFAEFQHADYGGTQLAARKRSAAAGVEFSLSRVLGFTLGVELHNYRDALHRENDYRARLLNAGLAARF